MNNFLGSTIKPIKDVNIYPNNYNNKNKDFIYSINMLFS